MNDDGGERTDLSGWASFQLGRMAAENERHTREAVRTVFDRHRPPGDVNALIAENQALAAENLRLKQDLSDYEFNYNNLKAWAGRAKARIEELKNNQP